MPVLPFPNEAARSENSWRSVFWAEETGNGEVEGFESWEQNGFLSFEGLELKIKVDLCAHGIPLENVNHRVLTCF